MPKWRVVTLKIPAAYDIVGGFAIIEGSRHAVDVVTSDDTPLSLAQLKEIAERERNDRAATRRRKKRLTQSRSAENNTVDN